MNNPAKMKFQTPDLTAEAKAKLADLFPGAVVEGKVNIDLLRAMLGEDVFADEAYEFTWVGKRAAIAEAGRPIRKTLRPAPDESRDWDTTENLYIEGDNLDVLKLLQESYLGKVKMVYIDPPYNTGNDFIYRDDFAQSREEYDEDAGVYDEDGGRLFRNTESNGRFHSDWCSMIYPRLVLARNLLRNDGVIFISIDDNEVAQLRKICDEVFGESNFVGQIIVKSNPRGSMSDSTLAKLNEYMLIYAKGIYDSAIIGHLLTEEMSSEYKYEENGRRYRLLGLRQRGGFWRRSERPNLYFPIYVNSPTAEISLTNRGNEWKAVLPTQPSTGEDGTWRWSKDKIFSEAGDLVARLVSRNGEDVWDIYQKDYLDKGDSERRTKAKSLWDEKEVNYQNGTTELRMLVGSGVFEYSKPVYLVKRAMEMLQNEAEDIILDFFSGSATTAHAVMQLNAEDGGKRKFIMVQLPEPCADGTEAAKAGYANICEIGKERIRRAGEKIKADVGLTAQNLDVGFRVLKLADTNMNEVYYAAGDYTQDLLLQMENNIKPDRTDMDLLFGCLLDWGLPLSMPHTHETIDGFTIHTYNGGDLIACFDEKVPESVVREIASRKPLRAVFRDSSFESSPQKINVFEIFKLLSSNTNVRVI
jgi:adenine-specific DNA-methyltransferase